MLSGKMDSAGMCQFGDPERIATGIMEEQSPAQISKQLHTDLKANVVCCAWKPHCIVLLLFVCCLSSSFALNVKVPSTPTPGYWWTIFGGVPSTSPLCSQSVPLWCRNSPLKPKLETLKPSAHVLQKRYSTMNLGNIDFKKPWRSLCVNCEKSHPRLSLTDLSPTPAQVSKAGQKMKKAFKAVGEHPDGHKKLRSKRSSSELSHLEASLAQNVAVRQRGIMNWVNKVFGIGERLPAQSSIVDVKKTSRVSGSLDTSNIFNFDNWEESIQDLLGSSNRKVESSTDLSQPVLLEPTFGNITNTLGNLNTLAVEAEAGIRALPVYSKPLNFTQAEREHTKAVTRAPDTTSKTLMLQDSEIIFGSPFTIKRSETLKSYYNFGPSFSTAASTSVSLPLRSAFIGQMTTKMYDVKVSFPESRYLDGRHTINLKSPAKVAPLLQSSTDAVKHTRHGFPKVLPMPKATASGSNSSSDVSASDYSDLPVTRDTKSSASRRSTESTAAPFDHATMLDRMLLAGGSINHDHLPSANVTSIKSNTIDQLWVSIYTRTDIPKASSPAVTSDTQSNADIWSSGHLPSQPSKLGVESAVTLANQSYSLTDLHRASGQSLKSNPPGPSFGSTLIRPIVVKKHVPVSKGKVSTTNHFSNLVNSNSPLSGNSQSWPYLGLSNLPTSLTFLTSAAGKNYPIRSSSMVKTETAESRIPPFTSSSISEAFEKEYSDQAIDQKSYPLDLVTSGPNVDTLNFSPGRTTISSLTIALKTFPSESDVSDINGLEDVSATPMFYSQLRNMPQNSPQRFNTAITPLAPVKQAPSFPAGLTVPLPTVSFHLPHTATAHVYDSYPTTKRNNHLASAGTSPTLPEVTNTVQAKTSETAALGSRSFLSPISDRVKTELHSLPVESVTTQDVKTGGHTAVLISNSTIKTSDTIQQNKELNIPSNTPLETTESDTSIVIPSFSDQRSVLATVKSNRIKRTLPTQYLSLLSSESYLSTKSASAPKCRSCIYSQTTSPVSDSLGTASPRRSSFANTKPDSSILSSPKWVTSHDSSFVGRPLTNIASTNVLLPARASSVYPTLNSSVSPVQDRASLSTKDTLADLTIMDVFSLFNSKMKRDTMKFANATPHEVQSAYSLSAAHTDATHLITADSFISPFPEALTHASFVKESKISTALVTGNSSTKAVSVKLDVRPTIWQSSLSTVPLTYASSAPFSKSFIHQFASGSRFTYNSIFGQSRSSISAFFSRHSTVQKHLTLSPSNEASTIHASSSYFRVPTSSVQASTSLESGSSLSAKSSATKAYGSHSSITSSAFPTPATTGDFSAPSNAFVSTLGISPSGIFSFKETANTTRVNRFKTLGGFQSRDELYTGNTASGATRSTHAPTGSRSPNVVIASASIVARTASKVANSSPHSFAGYQWTTTHRSASKPSIQSTGPTVATSPSSTILENDSSAFQKTTPLENKIWTLRYSTYKTNNSTGFHQRNPTPTNVTPLYNSPAANVTTGFQQTTPSGSTESTLLHSPVTATDDTGFPLDKTAFNNIALVTSSHSTVPTLHRTKSTVDYSSMHSPKTLVLLQPNSTVFQSSQSGVKASALQATSAYRLLSASSSPTRSTLLKRSTRETLSARIDPDLKFSAVNTSKYTQSASSEIISTTFLPRSLATGASLAPHVSVSKKFTNLAPRTTEVDNLLNDTNVTINTTLLANTSESLPRPNTELKLSLSTPILPVLPTAIVLTLKCRLTGIDYTPDLQNQSSPIYMALAREVQLTMNKFFSAKYGSNFIGTRIEAFLNGSVMAVLDVLFRNAPPPSSSDIIRTVVTEAYRMDEDHYQWKIAPLSVEANGRSTNNLDPEQLSISFLVLGMGFAASLNESDGPLQILQTEVVQLLSPIISLKKIQLVEVRNILGDLSIKGVLYINTNTHVDAMQILQALRSLLNHSVDLSSLAVAGARLDLQIYPIRIRILNRSLTAQLMDHSTMVFQQFSKELGTTVMDILRKGVPPLQMVVRELLSGSVVTQGELIFQSPAPPSKEVLWTLIDSVGYGNIFGSSSFVVDPTFFVVADAKPDNAEYPHFPGFAVAIIVMCGLVIIAIPVIIFLFLKTNAFGRHGKAIIQRQQDPERGQHNLELANRRIYATAE